MTHPIIKTDNYILITSDEEILIGDVVLSKLNQIILFSKYYDHKLYKKVIAHLPLNNEPILEGVPLLPPLEVEDDVDLICEKEAKKFHDKSKHGDDDMYNQLVYEDKLMIKIGYNKAKEKYKFTEEDVIKIVEKSIETGLTAEYLILSLSQPKLPVGFKCEIHDTVFGDIDTRELIKWKPKIINGVIQGEWIF